MFERGVYRTAANAGQDDFLDFCLMPKSLNHSVTFSQCSVYVVNTIQTAMSPSPLPAPQDCPGLRSHTEDKEPILTLSISIFLLQNVFLGKALLVSLETGQLAKSRSCSPSYCLSPEEKFQGRLQSQFEN